METIFTARRTVLEHDSKIWARKNRLDEFDIPMGASDSAEITDVVGVFLLHNLCTEFPSLGGGLYSDDALFTLHNHTLMLFSA